MHVSVVYAEQEQQWWLDVDLPEGATAIAAIHASGLLDLVEGIDLTQQKIGIFGKPVRLDNLLVEGDRVEIYRPLLWVPPQDEDEDD